MADQKVDDFIVLPNTFQSGIGEELSSRRATPSRSFPYA